MTIGLLEAVDLFQPYAVVGLLVFLRIGAIMALLPVFGEMMVPARLKIALAVVLTVLVTPTVSNDVLAGLDRQVLGAAATEIAIGLAHGFALRLFVFVLQVTGTIAAQATSLSQLFGGEAVDPQPALGVVLVLGGLALAASLGFHVRIVAMLVESYSHFPVGEPFPSHAVVDWATNAVSGAFRLAVVLAMPFLLASLLYNLALGVINRAMPQLMVAFVGAPAITFGALVLLALTTPLILAIWSALLLEQINHPLGVFNGG